MTAEPKAPGAAAVYLYREETTIDADHTYSIYVRLKVLTEKGKDYANVSVQYGSQSDGFSYSIESLAGRTVHSDGTVIPFTGKPYQRLIEKTHGSKTMEKAFTLPSVEVGSILEYRYKLHFGGNWLVAPTWTVQQGLSLCGRDTSCGRRRWSGFRTPRATSFPRGSHGRTRCRRASR